MPRAMESKPHRTGPPTSEAPFAALLERGRSRALAFLQRLGCADAEDVLQEALGRAWRYRESFDATADGPAWLLRIAFRAFLDWRAAQRRAVRADDDAVRAAPAPRPCASESRDELLRCLQPLSPIERALLLGFHRDGHSLAELAAAHRLPLNTVKSHLHRARARLGERSTP